MLNLAICMLFMLVMVPTTAGAIELIKIRKRVETTNSLLQELIKK